MKDDARGGETMCWGIVEKKCDRCGKVFIPTYNYAWRDKKRKKWYCSYTCKQRGIDEDLKKEGK
jgi:uncharacterized OB-fold protein